LQRGFDLPDATVNVLQGILFIAILLSETLHGRHKVRKAKLVVTAKSEQGVAA
jgi:ABC-type uncharacterized transport system permease subunit